MKSPAVIRGCMFNIQRFSIQDGPGIRTSIFFKGCPLECLWCSNPESQNPFPEIVHRDSLCIGCEDCLNVCIPEAISLSLKGNAFTIKIKREKCNNCNQCAEVCVAGALKVYGQYMTVDEVFDEVRKDMGFYLESGGGITASGGEPLDQAGFVTELFRRCHRIDIHTALDTCGYGNVSDLEQVLAETDLVLFDLKLMDSEEHNRFTKRNNAVILNHVRLVADSKIPMVIRMPLLPGINNSEKNLVEVARFISGFDTKLHIDLLPYHRFGQGKYKMLDRDYPLNVKPPSEEELQRAVEILKQYGLDCSIQK